MTYKVFRRIDELGGISSVLRIEAKAVGVTPEEYCDRFLHSFYENPEKFESIIYDE